MSPQNAVYIDLNQLVRSVAGQPSRQTTLLDRPRNAPRCVAPPGYQHASPPVGGWPPGHRCRRFYEAGVWESGPHGLPYFRICSGAFHAEHPRRRCEIGNGFAIPDDYCLLGHNLKLTYLAPLGPGATRQTFRLGRLLSSPMPLRKPY